MTEQSIFWTTSTTGDGTSEYTETQLFGWLRRTFNSDLYADRAPLKGYGDELEVTAGTGKVTVATGAAYVYGIPYENDADVDVTIPTPSYDTRIDRIILQADWTAKTVRIARLEGAEGGEAPALTQTPGTLYEVRLAKVFVTPSGTITVTDERLFCRFATEVATENIADSSVTAAKLAHDAGIPTGSVMPYAGSTAPSGWLLCNGSGVSRSTYATLFSVIGTTYGPGDGSTTFNLPNLKGRIVVGLDSSQTEFDSVGETGGEKTHTLTVDELPAHGHSITSSGAHSHTMQTLEGTGSYVDGVSGYDSGSTFVTVQSGGVDTGGAHTHTASNTGGGTGHNNLQPYMVMNYIIKY